VRKNRSAVLSLCAKGGLDARRTEMLRTLSELYDVPSAALPRLESLGWSGAGRDALAELRVLTDILISQGFGDDLRIDFSSVSRLKYYNGPVFFGSLPGVPESVLSGGRYDPLLARMGKSGGAIGFAVYLDRLERFCEAPSGPDGDLLLLYDEDDDPVRVSLLAENLAEAGGVIRVCRTAPEGLVFRRTLRFKEAAL
ncbi:MAG: ATP phosphoribosyltransferase regulatory subunit, partial [Synergistes sp.]|nr:ATP phosphoribosyltransferase regulatory subunit [Synergistes sp.]